jgi:imidazole glycerol-phosphate synthase
MPPSSDPSTSVDNGTPSSDLNSSTNNDENLIDIGLYLLDYGAGNVLSLINAIHHLGYSITTISSLSDFQLAKSIIFPGVGSFDAAMTALNNRGWIPGLKEYIDSGKPFMGICVGMQVLFQGSQESPGVKGLGWFPGFVKRFSHTGKSVPHIGWNTVNIVSKDVDGRDLINMDSGDAREYYYFVHSFAVPYDPSATCISHIYTLSTYGTETFISSIRHDNIFATQFHPEKSGKTGLKLLESFLKWDGKSNLQPLPNVTSTDGLSKRIIACLDVRADETSQKLIVTKGDQYSVRCPITGRIRNLGDPATLANEHYTSGADEIVFLNITSYRNVPLHDQPMLEVLRKTSKTTFVPLTIGGGIRDIAIDGNVYTALQVASEYFRSGADKVSIGSDAVAATREYFANGKMLNGSTSIEQISRVYGAQAVVVSIDPKRCCVNNMDDVPRKHVECVVTLPSDDGGPNGEGLCYWLCTVKGGREVSDVNVVELLEAIQAMGAGEVMVNCIDKDGQGKGFDIPLMRLMKSKARIPVIASSGAGTAGHFVEVFESTGVEAALAAGIFHKGIVKIGEVKGACGGSGMRVRVEK